MDLTFKTEQKKKKFQYLLFLPKHLRTIGLYSIISNLLIVFISLFFYPGLQKEIPLFYSQAEDQILIGKVYVFILPILATVINFIHLNLIKISKNIHPTILKIFIRMTVTLEVLILAILIRIILITN